MGVRVCGVCGEPLFPSADGCYAACLDWEHGTLEPGLSAAEMIALRGRQLPELHPSDVKHPPGVPAGRNWYLQAVNVGTAVRRGAKDGLAWRYGPAATGFVVVEFTD